MSITAFIPVRGGSKGIPGKNTKMLSGKPLLCYSVEAAVACKDVNKVVIATDADYIRQVIKEYFGHHPKVVLYARSEASASDTASTEMVMLEYAAINTDFDHLLLIQATSPLLTSQDLSGGIEKYLLHKANGLVSVVKQKRFHWTEKGDFATPSNYDYTSRPRRQDFEGYFVENGAFYVTSRVKLLANRCRISEPVVLWEMTEESFIELDEELDWQIIEKIMRSKKSSDQNILTEKAKKIKILLTDVDGVLTDAGMYYSEKGDELKKFNTRDGKAFELLCNAGIKTGIITAEDTEIVKRRAKKIKSDYLFQGAKDKLQILNQILEQTGFKPEEVAYVGDDLNDLSVLQHVGLSACPSNAVGAVRNCVNLILECKGGEGVVRELSEFILSKR